MTEKEIFNTINTQGQQTSIRVNNFCTDFCATSKSQGYHHYNNRFKRFPRNKQLSKCVFSIPSLLLLLKEKNTILSFIKRDAVTESI